MSSTVHGTFSGASSILSAQSGRGTGGAAAPLPGPHHKLAIRYFQHGESDGVTMNLATSTASQLQQLCSLVQRIADTGTHLPANRTSEQPPLAPIQPSAASLGSTPMQTGAEGVEATGEGAHTPPFFRNQDPLKSTPSNFTTPEPSGAAALARHSHDIRAQDMAAARAAVASYTSVEEASLPDPPTPPRVPHPLLIGDTLPAESTYSPANTSSSVPLFERGGSFGDHTPPRASAAVLPFGLTPPPASSPNAHCTSAASQRASSVDTAAVQALEAWQTRWREAIPCQGVFDGPIFGALAILRSAALDLNMWFAGVDAEEAVAQFAVHAATSSQAHTGADAGFDSGRGHRAGTLDSAAGLQDSSAPNGGVAGISAVALLAALHAPPPQSADALRRGASVQLESKGTHALRSVDVSSCTLGPAGAPTSRPSAPSGAATPILEPPSQEAAQKRRQAVRQLRRLAAAFIAVDTAESKQHVSRQVFLQRKGPWAGNGRLGAALFTWGRMCLGTPLLVHPSPSQGAPARVSASSAHVSSLRHPSPGCVSEVRADGFMSFPRWAILSALWDTRRRDKIDPWVQSSVTVQVLHRGQPQQSTQGGQQSADSSSWWAAGGPREWADAVGPHAAHTSTGHGRGGADGSSGRLHRKHRLPCPVGDFGLPSAHTSVVYSRMTPLKLASDGVPRSHATECPAESLTVMHWQVDPPSQGGSVYVVEVSLPSPSHCQAALAQDSPTSQTGDELLLNIPAAAAAELYACKALQSLRTAGHHMAKSTPLWAHVHVRGWIIAPRGAKRGKLKRFRVMRNKFSKAVGAFMNDTSTSGQYGAQLQQWIEVFGAPEGSLEGALGPGLHVGPEGAALGSSTARDLDAEGCDVTFIESLELQESLHLGALPASLPPHVLTGHHHTAPHHARTVSAPPLSHDTFHGIDAVEAPLSPSNRRRSVLDVMFGRNTTGKNAPSSPPPAHVLRSALLKRSDAILGNLREELEAHYHEQLELTGVALARHFNELPPMQNMMRGGGGPFPRYWPSGRAVTPAELRERQEPLPTVCQTLMHAAWPLTHLLRKPEQRSVLRGVRRWWQAVATAWFSASITEVVSPTHPLGTPSGVLCVVVRGKGDVRCAEVLLRPGVSLAMAPVDWVWAASSGLLMPDASQTATRCLCLPRPRIPSAASDDGAELPEVTSTADIADGSSGSQLTQVGSAPGQASSLRGAAWSLLSFAELLLGRAASVDEHGPQVAHIATVASAGSAWCCSRGGLGAKQTQAPGDERTAKVLVACVVAALASCILLKAPLAAFLRLSLSVGWSAWQLVDPRVSGGQSEPGEVLSLLGFAGLLAALGILLLAIFERYR